MQDSKPAGDGVVVGHGTVNRTPSVRFCSGLYGLWRVTQSRNRREDLKSDGSRDESRRAGDWAQ